VCCQKAQSAQRIRNDQNVLFQALELSSQYCEAYLSLSRCTVDPWPFLNIVSVIQNADKIRGDPRRTPKTTDQ
jgi:hypothetical protein